MDTSSSSSPRRRRRALHFDAPATRTAPLVTRPGRSRGHLHRVDPYAAIATGTAAFQPHKYHLNTSRQTNDSQVESSTRSDTTATNVNPGGHLSLRNLTNFTDRFRPLNGNDEVASLTDASQHSSSSSSVFTLSNSISSSESNSDNSTPTTRQPLHSTTLEGHSTSPNVAQNMKRSTVSRSITWANAINLASEQQQEALKQSKATSIGIGIGPMNHHHPLQNDVLPVELPRDTANLSLQKLVQQKGMNKAIQFTLRMQSKKLKTTMNRHQFFSNSRSLQKLLIVLVPILLISFSENTHTAKIHKHAKKHVDKITKPKGFEWTPNRRLNNRHCVLNMFIDKQDPDEFNPDYEEVKPGAKNKDGTPKLFPSPPKLEKGGTYRTKGQVKVILRFISSVADSYRPNLGIQQHLVFAGTRDGGHLAEAALKYWPPRGKFRTKLYIIADDEQAPTVKPRDHTDRALQYGPVDGIEQRFQNHVKSSNVHIFDSNGEKAGLVNAYVDDDDVAVAMEEEMFHANDDDTFGTDVTTIDDDSVLEARRRDEQKRRVMQDQEDVDGSGGFNPNFYVNEDSRISYFSLKKLLNPYLEREGNNSPESLALMTDTAGDRTKHVIPYFHVDGVSAEKQFAILQSARPLLLDETISVVGVENPGDMDVNDLIDFFHSIRYKTFLLGKKQVMRIDHLCDETLKDLMNHPYIAPKKPSLFRRALQKIGLANIDHYAEMKHPHPDHEMVYPPFFVAFPRGRTSFEEMTIQHMYDLFGGGGGGGQIATANDRKLPTKK